MVAHQISVRLNSLKVASSSLVGDFLFGYYRTTILDSLLDIGLVFWPTKNTVALPAAKLVTNISIFWSFDCE